MTKLRKLTALLLAGALTLLLLTACSGGGGSSGPKAQAEAEANVMEAINNDRANSRAAPLSNDPDMQRIAKDKLANPNLDADLKGNIGGYKFYHDVKHDEKTSTLTLIAQYDYKDTTLEKLIGYITKNNEDSNLNFNHSSNWTKVGVAVETHKGKTYIAIILQVKKT